MIKVKENKVPQHDLATIEFFNVKKLYLPLSQHLGKPSSFSGELGQAVKEGDVIASASGFISTFLNAPCDGKIKSVESLAHPVLKKGETVVIECEPQRKEYQERKDIDSLEKEDILDIIKKSGIVGMGGACFPTQVKLSPSKKIDTIIINGCECEPYLCCDYRLMIENLDQIFKGVEIIAKLVSCKNVIFAVEENKPQAIKKINFFISTKKAESINLRIAVLKSVYPQGGEKQLIYKTTERKVPSGGLPFDVGCLVHNVGTCFAIYQAICLGKPLIERLVTFAGGALKEPKNLWLKIGTKIKDLFDEKILEFKEEPTKIIYGGPMMGIALDHLEYPILKGSSGVLFLSKREVNLEEESNCIRCARCIDVCPMNLMPLQYPKAFKVEDYDILEEYNIADCMECGSCVYVCPARIPIIGYVKTGKAILYKRGEKK